jgi:electron transfer flavoprotein beta subunit
MNTIVIVREVWDTRDLAGQVLDDAGNIKASALTTRFEPEDLNGLEMALKIKDQHGGKVTVLSVGEVRQVDVLRESLYRGADEVISIKRDGNADTQATATLLAAAIRKIGGYHLILCGISIPEGENSLLAAHVAELLDLDLITWVDGIESIDAAQVVGKRAIEMGYEYIEAPLPALLGVGVALLEDDPRAPRSAKAMLKLKHKKTDIPAWSAADLGVAATATTKLAGYQPIVQRVIESQTVDTESESALVALLAEIRKGA